MKTTSLLFVLLGFLGCTSGEILIDNKTGPFVLDRQDGTYRLTEPTRSTVILAAKGIRFDAGRLSVGGTIQLTSAPGAIVTNVSGADEIVVDASSYGSRIERSNAEKISIQGSRGVTLSRVIVKQVQIDPGSDDAVIESSTLGHLDATTSKSIKLERNTLQGFNIHGVQSVVLSGNVIGRAANTLAAAVQSQPIVSDCSVSDSVALDMKYNRVVNCFNGNGRLFQVANGPVPPLTHNHVAFNYFENDVVCRDDCTGIPLCVLKSNSDPWNRCDEPFIFRFLGTRGMLDGQRNLFVGNTLVAKGDAVFGLYNRDDADNADYLYNDVEMTGPQAVTAFLTGSGSANFSTIYYPSGNRLIRNNFISSHAIGNAGTLWYQARGDCRPDDLQACNQELLQENLIWNQDGQGILLAFNKGWQFKNNTIVSTGPPVAYANAGDAGTEKWDSDLFYRTTAGTFLGFDHAPSTAFQGANNLYYSPSGAITVPAGTGVAGDPLFTISSFTPASYDFHIQTGSKAAGIGTGGDDAGAFQLNATCDDTRFSCSQWSDCDSGTNTRWRQCPGLTDCRGAPQPDQEVVSCAASIDFTPPTPPTGLQAVADSASQITLTWTAATDDIAVGRYKIYRATGASTVFAYLTQTCSVTFTDTGVQPQTKYSYQIEAVDTSFNPSAVSSPTSVTTPAGAASSAPPAVIASNCGGVYAGSGGRTASVDSGCAAGTSGSPLFFGTLMLICVQLVRIRARNRPI